MQFQLDAVDIEFKNVEFIRVYNGYRNRNRYGLRFYFYTDKFVSMGMLAKLKSVSGFTNYLKGSIHTAIQNMTDDLFEDVKNEINQSDGVVHNRSRLRHNIMKLSYSNGYKYDGGRHAIAYHDILEGYVEPIETRQDLIRAVLRITPQHISK